MAKMIRSSTVSFSSKSKISFATDPLYTM
jgi:hypothetical protein